MAGLVRAARRTFLSPHSRSLIQLLQLPPHLFPSCALNAHFQTPQIQCRNYVSNTRRKAFDDNILRLLRNEIQYELDRSPLPQLPKEVNGFAEDERPGEQWVRLEKKFGDDEEIKLEVTMFDRTVPVSKYVDGKESGQVGEEMIMHSTLIISIFKDDNDSFGVHVLSMAK